MNGSEALLKSLDLAVWELGEAFHDFPTQDFWVRPHPRLFSAGENAVHLCYFESLTFLGPDFPSPLVELKVGYFTNHIEDAPTSSAIEPAFAYEEIKRVHQVCIETFRSLEVTLEDINPYRSDWTWFESLRYMNFHFAYHTGQIYSVRHILGHETKDN